MGINTHDLYRHWAADELNVDVNLIDSVDFGSTIGSGSTDINSSDFSTFAGSEIWWASVDFKDGTYKSIKIWNQNPVRMLVDYAERKDYEICETAPTAREQQESIVARHIRD